MQQQQQQSSQPNLEIDMEIYNKLLKCGIFRANPQIKMNFEKKKTLLDAETSSILENGVALGKYILVLRDAMRRNNQDLNIDAEKIASLKPQSTPQTKLYNWNIITSELDKVGISIDSDAKSLIVAGDQEQILLIFQRVERFLTKIAGKQILNLDGLKAEQNLVPSTVESSNEKSNARRGNKPNQKKRVVKEGVDILTMNYDREPHDTESSLELILNTLCRAFQMKPKQAAALLTNNNQFLIHSIVKGVKGKYEPLIAWYQDLYANSKHLTMLLELEMEQFPTSSNCSKVLGTLSCGLYSHNLDICKWCSKLLTKVGYDFGQNQVIFDQAMRWFLEKEGGLELSLHAFKKHQDLAEDFVVFVSQFSSINDQIEQVYKTELKKFFSSPLEYVNAINDIFPFLVNESSNDVKKSGILDFWIESCIRQSDNDGKHSYDERIAAITLLSEIWLAFTDYIDKKEEIVNQVQQMLKRGARDKHRPIRTVAVALMFKLLDKFSEDKNSSAPSIYKTLIYSLVENPNESSVRQLYFVNFTTLFEQQQNIPVNLLIDPLIKQIQVSENITYFFKIFDFEFFTFLSKHPKLNVQNAIPMADLLAKIYLNDVAYSSAACIPYVQLCSRFVQEEAMQEFIVKFETICLSMMMGLEKNAEELQFKHAQLMHAKDQGKQGKKLLALPAPPQPQPIKKISGKKLSKDEKMKKLKEQDDDVSRRLKKSHIVEISMKILNLKHEEINDQLRDMLLSTNKRFNELYGFLNKGIMALLKWWGDPDQIMGTYIRAIEEREQREREEKERREAQEKERVLRIQQEKEKQEKEEKDRRQREAQEKLRLMSQSQANDEDGHGEDRRLMIGYDSADQMFRDGSLAGSKQASIRNSMAVLPYTGTTKINIKNQKAHQQIEKIKRNKFEKEETKRIDEERKRVTSAKRRQKLREQLDKRKLEMGIGAKSIMEDSKALIFKDGSIDQEKDRLKKITQKMLIPEIILLDMQEEEERDREALNVYMKKYAKLWKNLYYKYSNSGFSSKQVSNFDQFQEKSQSMNYAEMSKLLKDNGTFPQLINKDELATIFRLINSKLFNRNDIQGFDYNGYLAFIPQLAYFCFSRSPKDLSHLPPVESLKALISQFEQATKSKGNSTVLFEDPDATGMGDQQLIKALNEKLKQDPQYPIPEGYFKQVEKVSNYEYRIPEQIMEQLDEATIMGVELMDELLDSLFGIHILEPLVTFEECLKVRPMIRNQIKPQAEALNYMRRVEKKVKPLENQLNPYASLATLEKIKINQEIKPQLNVNLKLEVAQYPLSERPHVQEVAEFLEELLQATEKGLDHLPPRANKAPGQVWNEVKQKKNEDQIRDNDIKITKEDKRKKRDDQIKNELLRINEAKKQQQDDQKQSNDDQKRKAADDSKKRLDDSKRINEQKKQQIIDLKQGKLEEVMKKKEDDSEKNKELQEQKKKERVEFMKKQKQKLGDEFSQIKNDRDQVQAKQEEIKKKEIEYQQRIRSQMENFIKENQDDKGKEQEERRQINEFIKQHDIESIFSLYDKSLRHMFKFYASQDKKDLQFSLEKSMNTMNMREFIRFGYQQMIIPVLLQPDDIVQIYRQLIRERIEEISGGLVENYFGDNNFAQVLDFEYFKKALIRIAVMSQDQLGGLKEDLLAGKLEKQTKLKEEEQKKKDKLRNQMDNKSKAEKDAMEELKEEFKQKTLKPAGSPSKALKNLSDDVKYEINESAKEKEDAFFKAWIKQREAQGISLKKRIIGNEKDLVKKITIKKKKVTVKEGTAIDGIREGDDMVEDDETAAKTQKSGLLSPNAVGSLGNTRKTREIKMLRELEEKEHQKDQLGATKIEKKRIKKELNVEIISAKTVEALLKYLGITPEDATYMLDKKLNQNRIEIQGQKPSKIKKQMKPQKLDHVKEGGANLNTSIVEQENEGQNNETIIGALNEESVAEEQE